MQDFNQKEYCLILKEELTTLSLKNYISMQLNCNYK